jgi:CPA2 family monovalent cation:H+ antiporter-2
MVADPIFFRDLAYVLVAAVVGGALARAAHQPLVLGYVLGGILIGPFTPGPSVSDVHTFEVFAEIGVVLLMFSVGIEFSLRDLLRVRWVALAGGPVGILLSVAVGVAVGALLGWPPLQGAAIGAVVSVASTMVLTRLLLDRGQLHSRHGRIMMGIALVEDLAVVVLTVLLPALGALEPGRFLAIAAALGKAALILVPFAALAAKGVPGLLTRAARTQNDELFLLVALTIGVSAAALTQAVGLSLALGAFLGGLLISESDYAHEALARLLSLRDVFVALFFVTVGALVDPRVVLTHLPLLGVIIGLIVVGKAMIRTLLVWVFGHTLATALLVGVGLAQIGEFSFVLVQVARRAGHVGDDVYNATLAAALVTILINALLVRWAPALVSRLQLPREPAVVARPEHAAESHRGSVLVCGFGRVGSAVGEALETFGVSFTVIERDPDVVQGLRARGVACLFGDAAHREHLRRAGVAQATLVVMTLPEIDRARLAVRAVRALNPKVPLLARAHGRAEAEALRTLGATEVIQPEVEASATLIRHSLDLLDLPRGEALAYLARFRTAMEQARAAATEAAKLLPEVQEVRLPAGQIADQSLREARIRERFGVTVVAIGRSQGQLLNPEPETILRAGDRLRLFGLAEQIEAFMAEARKPG